MLIRPREPFSLAHTLGFILSPPALLNGREFAPLLDYCVDGEYRRAAEVHGQPVLYVVREERSRLEVRILAGPNDPATERAVVAQVERQFATNLDLKPFYALA